MDIVLAIEVALATTAIFTIPNGMLLWSVPATYLAILLTTAANLGIWATFTVFASSIVAFASVCLIFAMVNRVAAVSDQTNKQLEEDVHVLIILLPLISAIMSSYFTALCTM